MSPREKWAYNDGFRKGVLSVLEVLDDHENERARRWAKLREKLKKKSGSPPTDEHRSETPEKK